MAAGLAAAGRWPGVCGVVWCGVCGVCGVHVCARENTSV